ncbi:MAG: TIGR03085 family metal-binding protein [Actinomycetota bacterium]|nr:TIGR03085 family metal-binding protein [Actinomycetota bacterium]
MLPLSRRERLALCDLLARVGPEAPTLCRGWSAYDLAAHLVLRETLPVSSAGIVVPWLSGLTGRSMRRLQRRHGFTELVDRLRAGPPRWSPLRTPRLDAAANTMEFFVHHEDVRRARAGWSPRTLETLDEDALWSVVRRTGRMLLRRSPVGVELVRTDRTAVVRVQDGEPTLVVRGLPAELAMFAHGRGAVAQVEYDGDADARAAFAATFTDSPAVGVRETPEEPQTDS